MGSNKLLLMLDGKTIIEHILENLAGYETIMVTGHRPEDIKAIAETHGAKVVHNPNFEQGMTTSFQAGLRAVGLDVDAVFMVLSDTYGFKPELLDELAQKMASEGALLVSPVFEGMRGHPVLVSRRLFPEFLGIGEGETMKDIVQRHEEDHLYVEGDIWTVLDLDTPEDYTRMKRLWATR